MERATLMSTMKTSIFNVLETMFFQLIQFDESGSSIHNWFSGNPLLLGSSIKFNGPVSGECFFLIPEKTANEITADFLGLETVQINQKQREDTVKEALNMIGGNMLSQLDRPGDFKLGIPEMIETEHLAIEKLDQFGADAILIEAQTGRLATGFHLD